MKLEQLENRNNPVVLASDIAHAYNSEWNPMPGMALDKVGVVSHSDADLFFALEGGAPRLRALHVRTGDVLFDEYIFDERLRMGFTSLVPIGDFGYVTLGEGAGPVVAKVNLESFEVSYFMPESFPESWRHGLKLYTADVNGNQDLLVLPNGQAGGPIVYVMDVEAEVQRFTISIGPSDFRGEMELVPAGGGVQLSNGRMGAFWQEVGKPETTVGVAWDGFSIFVG